MKMIKLTKVLGLITLISLNAFALFVGTLITTKLLKITSINKIIFLGLLMILIGSLCMEFISSISNIFPEKIFIITTFIVTLGSAMVIPMANSCALNSASDLFGNAVALSSFARYSISAIFGGFIAYFEIQSIFSIAIIFFLASILGMYYMKKVWKY